MHRKLISVLIMFIMVLSMSSTAIADTIEVLNEPTQEELYTYDKIWMEATDEERYYMDTEIKARAVGLSTKEFKFFARVVEGEGRFCEDDLTDKVLVACVVTYARFRVGYRSCLQAYRFLFDRLPYGLLQFDRIRRLFFQLC